MKHGDIGSVTASEAGLLIFIDDEANCSNRKISEVHRSILDASTCGKKKASKCFSGWRFRFTGNVIKNYGQKHLRLDLGQNRIQAAHYEDG